MAERKKNPVIQARNEEIRVKYSEGVKASVLADEHDLSVGSIYQICKGVKKRKESSAPKDVSREADPPEEVSRPGQEISKLSVLSDRLEELINRVCGMTDLYESEGFYENRLISTVKNYRFSRMGGQGSGVVMIIQVPDVKKAREAARKGFVRFFPES